MANIYGVEVKTPEEITAEQQAQFAEQASRGDVNAYARQAVFNIFGSPELKKSQKLSSVITDAMTNFQEDPTKDPLENEMERARIIRDRTAGIDPQVAIQANNRYLVARNELDQRNKMLAEEDRAKAEFGWKKDEHETAQVAVGLSQTPVIYKVNDQTGIAQPVKVLPKGADPALVARELQAIQQSDPNGQYTSSSALDMYDLQKMFKPPSLGGGSGDGWNNSTAKQFGDALQGGVSYLKSAEDFANALAENPDSLNKYSREIETASGGILQGAKSVAERYGFVEGEQWSDEMGQGFLNKIEKYGVQTGAMQARVLAMAYSLAKTLDQGGRLSNQDVDMAIDMIAGPNGSPETIYNLLKERISSQDTGLILAKSYGMNTTRPEIRTILAEYNDRLGRTDEWLKRLGESIVKVRAGIVPPTPASSTVTVGGMVPAPTGGSGGSGSTPAPKVPFTIKPKG